MATTIRRVMRPNIPKFCTPNDAADLANDALEIARSEIESLQRMTSAGFEDLISGGDYMGRKLLETFNTHAATPEFGKLLWEKSRVGQSVLELIERQVALRIAEREAARPHRRLLAGLRTVIDVLRGRAA